MGKAIAGLAFVLVLSGEARANLPTEFDLSLPGFVVDNPLKGAHLSEEAEPEEEALSLGAPPSQAFADELNNGPFAKLDVPDDALPEGADYRTMSKKKLYSHYSRQIKETLASLEKAREARDEPGLLVHFGEEQFAAKGRSRARPRMSGVSCLAVGIQSEAGNQSYAGMLATGQTIYNRAGRNGSRVCGVLHTRAFESTGIRGLWKRPSGNALRAAQAVVSGRGGSWTNFYAPVAQARLGRKKPRWAVDFERRGCRRAVIDDQIYYDANHCGGRRGRRR